MKKFKIDGNKLTDWNSFHSEFKIALSFPDYYGENMNAWIDCVDDLTEQPTLLHIENGNFLKENKPDLLNAILECGAFVNYRKIEQGEKPNLIISTSC
ncbi:barstar family protein [Allomuricauda sp. d1]|uniref:barstar family protein n=1 Tax=Allomuricauda sp. d1 TaxID=3136725 RepID=UPI0031DDA54E